MCHPCANLISKRKWTRERKSCGLRSMCLTARLFPSSFRHQNYHVGSRRVQGEREGVKRLSFNACLDKHFERKKGKGTEPSETLLVRCCLFVGELLLSLFFSPVCWCDQEVFRAERQPEWPRQDMANQAHVCILFFYSAMVAD